MTRHQVLVGDALQRLAGLPDASVQCCICSPPYWGLRSYDPATHSAGMIGLEPTFEEHLANLVAIFAEVRRVLRPDGTVWLNYGDAYAGAGRTSGPGPLQDNHRSRNATAEALPTLDTSMWKPKDLMLLPARVALALQADGWWLRSEIIWHKPNPMPESVRDRPTQAHEKVWLLTPSARYFYDVDAVRQPMASGPSDIRKMTEAKDRIGGKHKTLDDQLSKASAATRIGRKRSVGDPERGANLRNVWNIATAPYPGAHFATFPAALVEPCIRAGTSEKGCCTACGAPHRRVTDVTYLNPGDRTTNGPRSLDRRHETAGFAQRLERSTATVGWVPTCCDCYDIIATGHVLEPDPTPVTGRKGLNRTRSTSPPRPMTRGQQRVYADQLRRSPHLDEIRRLAGDACDHYLRSDSIGGRPPPPDLLDELIARGWLVEFDAPVCACNASCIQCGRCGFVLDSRHEHRGSITAYIVPKLWEGLPAEPQPQDVLQPSVLPGSDEGTEADDDLRLVRPDVHRSAQYPDSAQTVLFEGLCGEVQRPESNDQQGLDDHLEGLPAYPPTGPSERDDTGLRDGAPTGDGGPSGAVPDQHGSGPPSERRQDRQPDREPAADDQAGPRQPPPADLLRDMPELRSHLPDAGECPHCGCTEWRPPDTRPAVVLDCFAGSGTVGLAADRLQRDSVLIEVSPAYAAMAAERIQADSPLFAEVTVT